MWLSASRRVVRVDGHVLVREVGEEDLGLGAVAGQDDVVLDLRRRATASASVGRSNGIAVAAAQTCTSSMKMSSASGAVSGSAAPTACAIRPQFGSPPCSAALTSGELATARAARATTVLVAAAHDHAADALGALAVAHDVAARACAAPSRAPRRSGTSSSDCGSIRTPLAPDACRITVSLVESCPSTETRSNERCDAHAEQQVGGLGATARRRSGRSRASSRTRARSSRRPWPARSAARSRRAARRRPRPPCRTCRWCGSPREKSPWPCSRSSRRGGAMPRIDLAGVQQHADHAGRGDRDLVLGRRRRPSPRRPACARRPRSRGRPVAALALPELATTTRRRVEPRALLGQHAPARRARRSA